MPAQIGTVIHGTLRSEDLLKAFADELERLNNIPGESDPLSIGAHAKLIEEARVLLRVGESEIDGKYGGDVIGALMDALNDFAPEGCYFGALQGDGSDFGFWQDEGDFHG